MSAPILITAGGTGGHLFPAQALAQELVRRGHSIVLMTDERVAKFEKLFPGAEIVQVPSATPSGGGAIGLVRVGPVILSGVLKAFGAIRRLKPAIAIGFGGYPTLPPLLAALLARVPVAIHEQNAVLGRANRVVAPYARAIGGTFDDPKFLRPQDRAKLVLTGNPVRDAVSATAGAPYVMPEPQGPFELLVFGGSQGARVMSEVVPEAVSLLPEDARGRLRVIQQARAEDIDRVRTIYDKAGIAADLQSFFDDMPSLISKAQLVIARAGASTVSELAVIGRPSILVPLPHSLDNDQKTNAERLVATGAAVMIEQKDFTPKSLAETLARLMDAPETLAGTAAAALALGQPQAVSNLADLVERVASGGEPHADIEGVA